ncbi:hypothetical protein PMAYCL1PPCAC_28941, partial [Pristionchus mayeri]
FEVRVGELRRRVDGPEKMSSSHMCAFLRNYSNMYLNGIFFFQGLQSTSWSSLTEREAMDLARETGNALSLLPISQKIKDQSNRCPEIAVLVSKMARRIEEAMKRVGETPEEGRVETSIDYHILRFALITHHFGHSFFVTVMQWLQSV